MKMLNRVHLTVFCLLLLYFSSTQALCLAACAPPAEIVGQSYTYVPGSVQNAYDYASSTLNLTDFTLRLSGEILSEDLVLDGGSVVFDGGYDCSFASKMGTPTGIFGTLTITSGTAIFGGDIAIVSTDQCSFDNDIDGFYVGPCAPPPLDCNDNDPVINPGTLEICDGIDNNCNGQIDEGVIPTDADGDGYYAIGSCGDPELNNDCNDAAATINPGALDIPFDGIDQDCSGSDQTFAEVAECTWCHRNDIPGSVLGGPELWTEMHSFVAVPNNSCATCHIAGQEGFVLPGHYGQTVLSDGNNMTAGDTIVCVSCHDFSAAAQHPGGPYGTETNTVWGKVEPSPVANRASVTCETCHDTYTAVHADTAAAHNNRTIIAACGECHTSDPSVLGSPGIGTLLSDADVDLLHGSDCALCHNYTGNQINAALVRQVIALGVGGTPVSCTDCHNAHDHNGVSGTPDCTSCHTHSDPQIIEVIHNNSCTLCHDSPRTEVQDAITSGQAECIDCHNAHDHSAVSGTPDCTSCHAHNDPQIIEVVHNNSCTLCHDSPRTEVQDAITSGQAECIDCHATHDGPTAHDNLSAPATCAVCHTDKITGSDFNYLINNHGPDPTLGHPELERCQRCHNSSVADVVNTITTGKGTAGLAVTCENCHLSQHAPILSPVTTHNVLVNVGACGYCHDTSYRTHSDMVATSGCANCHVSANQDEYNALHQNDCLLCHLSSRTEVITAIYAGIAGTQAKCVDCHQQQHQSLSCNNCHGFPPTTALADSHARHDQIGYTCDQCHYDTTTDGVTITNQANHLNWINDVAPGVDFVANNTTFPLDFAYSPDPGGGTCSNISCHLYFGYSDPIKWGNINLSASPQITHGDESFEIDFNVVVTSCGYNYTCVEPYTCEFHWGDGAVETGVACNASHIYPAAGDYTVTWSVRDANNMTISSIYQSNTVSVDEVIPPATIGSILVDYDPATDIVTVTPPAQTSNGDPINRVYAYWDDGNSDDNFGAGQPLSHQYSAIGTYQISLTLYDSNLTQFDVTVAEEPALEITVDSL